MPEKSIIKPKALKPGDTIAIVSPAGPTLEIKHFEQGEAMLRAAGYQIKRFPHAHHRQYYLAGTDAERQADLIAAFTDPEVDMILCARGGYGCTRILSDDLIQITKQHPKLLIGFSDVTALLVALYQQANLSGCYGPMLTSNLIDENTYTWDNLFNLVSNPDLSIPYSVPNQNTYHCISTGTVEAPLFIGNLTLLAALCGTSYQPNPAGHILCIEDWKESHYSLDRQFQQLRMSGVFDNIKGLLLCDFSQTTPEPNQSLLELFTEQFSVLDIPVGYGFSVGHGSQTATLPMGIQARFNATTGTLALLEPAVN